jgi:hypothetical protein
MPTDRTADAQATTPLQPGSAPITDPHHFLELSAEELDAIFTGSAAGAIPVGEGEGTAIIAPGTEIADELASFVHIFTWKGKVFQRDAADPARGVLKNRILPLGHKAIVAQVYRGESWFDGQECIVLDYSQTSIVAQWIRDEIREVSPGVYLGLVYWGKQKAAAKRLIHFALKF